MLTINSKYIFKSSSKLLTRHSNVINNNFFLLNNIKMLSTRAKKRNLPPPIKLTENAAVRIKDLLSNKPEAQGIELSVRRRGCNGYSYTMNYAEGNDDKLKNYELVHDYDVNVYIDPKAIFFLVGTEMDYVDTPMASEFTFTNPNAKGSCGCGESFNV